MSIAARFPGECRKCGGRFPAGTLIDYVKGAGSSHVVCPAARSTPSFPAAPAAKAPVVDAGAAPFEISVRMEPCKRPVLDRQLAGMVGETRHYPKHGAYLRAARGEDRKPLPGFYVVMGSGSARYQSAEDNEDMGDCNGANWSVVLYLRAATEAEITAYQHQELGAAMPSIWGAFARMVQRMAEQRAKTAMDAAAARPGWGRVELAYVEALGPAVVEARKSAVRLWEGVGNDSSYVASFTFEGETIYESHHYVYDWDLPTLFVAPLPLIERAQLAQGLVGLGRAIERTVYAMEQRAKTGAAPKAA